MELCYSFVGARAAFPSSSGNRSGRSAAWLARLVRDQEVDGSNPFAPTTSKPFLLIEFTQPLLRRLKQPCCRTMEQLKSPDLAFPLSDSSAPVFPGTQMSLLFHL